MTELPPSVGPWPCWPQNGQLKGGGAVPGPPEAQSLGDRERREAAGLRWSVGRQNRAQLDSIVYIHCLCLINSSIDGFLECFHVLAVVSNAAGNIVIHILFELALSFKGTRKRTSKAQS